MKKFLFILPYTLYLIPHTFSQPSVEWQADFAKSAYDRPYGICTNSMGEILVCGGTWNDSNQTYDGTILKLDFAGNKIWQKNFGYGNADLLTGIAALPAGGYVLCGRTDSKGEGAHDFWIMKIDEKGNLLWEKTYGGKFEDKAENIFATKNGELIVSGSRMTVSSSNIEAWVFKLSADGEKIWDKQIGGHFRCYAQAAGELSDKIIIAGYMDPHTQDKYKENKGRVIALDQNGNILWDKIFGGPKEASGEDRTDELSDMLVTMKNEIAVCGLTESKGKNSSADMWIMKLNEKGEIIWEQTFGDISSDKAQSIALTKDGIHNMRRNSVPRNQQQRYSHCEV